MLDSDRDPQALSETLAACVCDVVLPSTWNDYFDASGVTPTFRGDGRRFPRFNARGKAALEHRQSLPGKPRIVAWHGIYMKNISREGIGFLHSEQLFPSERMRLALPDGVIREIEVVYCRQIQDRCYVVGARFIAADQHAVAPQ